MQEFSPIFVKLLSQAEFASDKVGLVFINSINMMVVEKISENKAGRYGRGKYERTWAETEACQRKCYTVFCLYFAL